MSIWLLGKEIRPIPVAKDLGVYIDQSLTYNDHIAKTVSNCLFKIVQICRIKHLLDRKSLILLMNNFVFSKMYYCSTVWANTSQSNVKKLQLVQNFAARIVLGLRKYDHVSQGIRSLNWLTVKDRIFFNDAVMVFKCINNLSCGQCTFMYRGCKLWINLSNDLKTAENVKVFRHRLLNELQSGGISHYS